MIKVKKSSKHKGPRLIGGARRPSTTTTKRVSLNKESPSLLNREKVKTSMRNCNRKETTTGEVCMITQKSKKRLVSRVSQQKSLEDHWQKSSRISKTDDYNTVICAEIDSEVEDNKDKMKNSIRYSRRMPLFPPVSNSHVQAQAKVLRQSQSSPQARESIAKVRTSVVARQQSVERKNLLHPTKLSVVSLKLPNIS